MFDDGKRMIRHARCVACALFASSVTAVAADEPDLSWLDWQALQAGKVLVRADRDVQPLTVQVKLAALVASSAQAIWDVLVACQIAPEYVPNVVSCRSLELVEDGKAQLFVQTVKPAFFLPTFEHVFRLDYYPYERIDVHRVSGPIALMEGSWWLLPQQDGKILLIYQLAVDPGLPVPRFFVRATMKRDLPRVVQAVRERAEAAR